MKIYFPLLFGLMAAYFLWIGLKVVLQKKPLLLPSRFFFAVMVLAFSPQLFNTTRLMGDTCSSGISILLWLNPVMFMCLLIFFWIQMKGYILIGIHDESFREALHFSLNKNKLKFEERLSIVALTEEKADLQVAIQSWTGVGQLKLRKSKNKTLIKNIVGGINEYYAANCIKPNNITSVFYIVMGLLMLICAVAFFFVFSKLDSLAA
ncbi:hypothetical protein P4B35_19730 [Pontiellaceae bacterium B12227]|nr:hypothetical protein [Pontiellaceae bacterium B12227]